jgi:hypothetical protein
MGGSFLGMLLRFSALLYMKESAEAQQHTFI